MPSTKIGTYLFTRLKQLGIQTVFGVPGGYVYLPLTPSRISKSND
jgi:TPP-dependent 2-oxoacid decarboxylase